MFDNNHPLSEEGNGSEEGEWTDVRRERKAISKSGSTSRAAPGSVTPPRGAGTHQQDYYIHILENDLSLEEKAQKLITSYQHNQVGGWQALYQRLKTCADLFGNLLLDNPYESKYALLRHLPYTLDKLVLELQVQGFNAKRHGNKEDAASFYQRAHTLEHIAKSEHARHSIMIFEIEQMDNFKERSINELQCDLHGQLPDEAVLIAKIHIWFAIHMRTVRVLRIVTGWGKHSTDYDSEVKKAVDKMLKEKNMKLLPNHDLKDGSFRIDIKGSGQNFDLD